MPSGWNVYYVVFLSALLALGIPVTLAILSSLLSPKSLFRGTQQADVAPAGSAIGRKINTRFFLGANAGLILITLGLLLIPAVVTLRGNGSRDEIIRGVLSIASVAAFAAIGLLYASRKGDLSWLRSYKKGGEN